MIMPLVSRLNEPAVTATATPPPRRRRSTPAQREASRRNGSKSRGPITAAGKNISKMNALKHGLIAEALCPPTDGRGEDRLYRKIHRELVAELRPRTFTQRAAVDMLALSYVQRARAARMIEARLAPEPLSKRDQAQWDQTQQARRELKAIKRALVEVSGGVPACKRKTARLVGRLVADLIEYVRADLAEAQSEGQHTASSAGPHTGDPVDDILRDGPAGVVPNSAPCPEGMGIDVDQLDRANAEELQELQQWWDALGEVVHQLADRQDVEEILVGQRRVGRELRTALKLILDRLESSALRRVRVGADIELEVRQRQELALLKVGKEPTPLLLLQRYQHRIDGDIRRLLRALQDR